MAGRRRPARGVPLGVEELPGLGLEMQACDTPEDVRLTVALRRYSRARFPWTGGRARCRPNFGTGLDPFRHPLGRIQGGADSRLSPPGLAVVGRLAHRLE